MGYDQKTLSDANVQLEKPEFSDTVPNGHQPVTYLDRLGKVRIEVFPDSCTQDDLYKAINFLQQIVAKKDTP